MENLGILVFEIFFFIFKVHSKFEKIKDLNRCDFVWLPDLSEISRLFKVIFPQRPWKENPLYFFRFSKKRSSEVFFCCKNERKIFQLQRFEFFQEFWAWIIPFYETKNSNEEKLLSQNAIKKWEIQKEFWSLQKASRRFLDFQSFQL